MRPERVTAPRSNVPIQLVAEVPGVFRCPIVVPATFRERLRGIKRMPLGHGVLLATSAVHSVGLKYPIRALALDDEGAVLATHELVPDSTWRHGPATWILELPRWFPMPTEGATVRLLSFSQRPPRFETRPARPGESKVLPEPIGQTRIRGKPTIP